MHLPHFIPSYIKLFEFKYIKIEIFAQHEEKNARVFKIRLFNDKFIFVSWFTYLE